MRIFRPDVFQGNFKKKNYFEGWYFKQVSADLLNTLAIIPGVSLVKNDPHAFIQIMDGSTGKTDYIRYDLKDFRWDRRKFAVEVGSSVFTDKGISLDVKSEHTDLAGRIDFSNIVRYPARLLSPGIMGWYSFVPFMECNHGVVSVNHGLKGSLSLNGKEVKFDGGKGYIEKDWGISFPEAWIWVQSNNFGQYDASFMLSIAKIPWMGKYFVGLISFLYLNNRFYLFSTYNRSAFAEGTNNNNTLQISLRNKSHVLRVSVNKNSFSDLQAPVSGEMSRRIKESIDSRIHLQLSDESGLMLYEDTGTNVGLEITDGIFRYI